MKNGIVGNFTIFRDRIYSLGDEVSGYRHHIFSVVIYNEITQKRHQYCQ